MNLAPLTFSLSQINYLVINLSKKNFARTSHELSQVRIMASFTIVFVFCRHIVNCEKPRNDLVIIPRHFICCMMPLLIKVVNVLCAISSQNNRHICGARRAYMTFHEMCNAHNEQPRQAFTPCSALNVSSLFARFYIK